MKKFTAQYKPAPNVLITFECDGGVKDYMEQMQPIQEILSISKCGKCKGEKVRYQVREVDGNKFYELVCQEQGCRAKLAFGQHKKGGTLFPKLKDDDGKYLPNEGWEKWTGPAKETT